MIALRKVSVKVIKIMITIAEFNARLSGSKKDTDKASDVPSENKTETEKPMSGSESVITKLKNTTFLRLVE